MDRHELAKIVIEAEGLPNDVKSELLNYIRSHKKFGLVWEDKPEAIEERLQNELPVLTEVKEKAIISKDLEAPNHIIIEGDNLEALTTLAYTHAGKIDVIYIDPPYNTGKKDFIYNDSYVDTKDEYRHSKWLSFMEKRLKIAKQLLANDGVIFISIDENEVGQLRLLGDEIFQNFVGQWNWFKSATPPALSKKIKRNVEYILCWQGRENNETFRGVKKVSKSNDPFTKPQNSLKTLVFPPKTITCKLPDGIYPAGTYGTQKFPNELLCPLIVDNGKNANEVSFCNRFIWVQSTLNENINNGLYVELSKSLVLSYKRAEYSPEVPPNLIDISVGVDTTENAGRKLAEIFDGISIFDYPKPVELIKYLIDFKEKNDLTILDFFAGSGTTLQATMELNERDREKYHHRCILVQAPEITYELVDGKKVAIENSKEAFDAGYEFITEITYERNKRVINGYTTPKGEEVAGLNNNNLRYYKTDFVPAEKTNANKRTLVAAATDMLCVKNDIYTEQELFAGRKLKKSAARYFANGKKQMLIIYNELAVETFAELIRDSYVSESKLLVYVFSVNNYAYTDTFEEVLHKVELCALPDAIYKAYKSVIKPKRKPLEQTESIVEEYSEKEGELNNNKVE